MWVLLLTACRPPPQPPAPAVAASLDPLEPRRTEFILDPGRIQDGEWVSTPPVDRLGDPPPLDDLPAVWVSLSMAEAWCGWQGGRLPTRSEWETAAGAPGARVTDRTRDRYGPSAQPAGASTTWLDLRGNVAEWLEDGTIAGGSWVSRPDELGLERVPPEARSDTIGFRCVWG